MYKEFYGFSEDPFALNPDPQFLYPSRSHLEALFSMVSGIKKRRGIIVVTGEAGVGKTILIYILLKDLGEKIKAAFIFNPRLDFKDILETILRDLDLPLKEKGENLFSLLVRFRKYLKEKLAQGETVTIVIDEAQSLDEEVLEGLFRLATPDPPSTNSLQILLVGHPELELKLNSEKLRPFKDRVAIEGRIRPLTREESREYINHRLKLVGRDLSDVFSDKAINKIWEFAKGNPRIINLLCDRALLVGCGKASVKVDLKIVREAITDFKHFRVGKYKTPRAVFYRKKSPYKMIRILFFSASAGVFIYSLSKILSLWLQR